MADVTAPIRREKEYSFDDIAAQVSKNSDSLRDTTRSIETTRDRISDFTSEVSARPQREPPPLPVLPEPPKMEETNPLTAFGSFASTLALLGAGTTRAPFRASLKASTAAMKALNQRDLQNYQNHFKEWEAQTDYALKTFAYSNDRYKTILENDRYSDNQKLTLIKAEASLNSDRIALHAAQAGDLGLLGRLFNDRETLKIRADEAKNGVKIPAELFNTAVAEYEKKEGVLPPAQWQIEKWAEINATTQKPSNHRQAWEMYSAQEKAAGREPDIEKFPAWYAALGGKITFEQRQELQQQKISGAISLQELRNEGALQIAQMPRDAISQAYKTWKAQPENAQKEFGDFEKVWERMHGTQTPEERKELQGLKDAAAKERTEIQAKSRETAAKVGADAVSGRVNRKVNEQVTSLKQIQGDVQDLLKRVESDPTLVGGLGIGRRIEEGARSVFSAAAEKDAKAHAEAAAQAKQDLIMLRARIANTVLNTKYFSGPAQKAAQEILPGLELFDDPGKVLAALKSISRTIDQDIAAKEQTLETVDEELRTLSNDELLRKLRE